MLSVLLYGCESWCLTEVLFNRLRVFRARCLRVMARVTADAKAPGNIIYISTEDLMRRLGLRDIDYLYWTTSNSAQRERGGAVHQHANLHRLAALGGRVCAARLAHRATAPFAATPAMLRASALLLRRDARPRQWN